MQGTSAPPLLKEEATAALFSNNKAESAGAMHPAGKSEQHTDILAGRPSVGSSELCTGKQQINREEWFRVSWDSVGFVCCT